MPFPPARKRNRESLEQLHDLILTLTEEVKELQISNAKLMEGLSGKSGMTRDFDSSGGKPGTSSIPCFHLYCCLSNEAILTRCSSLNPGSPSQCQDPNSRQLTQPGVIPLLPESSLLWGLVSHFVSTSSSSYLRISILADDLLCCSLASDPHLCIVSWVHRCFSIDL